MWSLRRGFHYIHSYRLINLILLYCSNIIKPIFFEVVFKRFMEQKWRDAFNVVAEKSAEWEPGTAGTKKQLNLQERKRA
jgi:hypothetical protein